MHSPAERVCFELKRDIEALAETTEMIGEPWPTAWNMTRRGTPFAVVANGFMREEGGLVVPPRDSLDMADLSLSTAKRMREKIDGPAHLTWRILPELEGGAMYMRLAFDPATEN